MPAATSRADVAEGSARNAARLLDRVERPEAVDDPDLEAAAAGTARRGGSQAVLGQVAAQARHIVAAVVEEHEQAATRAQDAAPRASSSAVAPRNAIHSDDDVGRAVGRVDRAPVRSRCERDPRAELGELPGADPVGAVEQQHVASAQRPQCVERPRDLRLDIDDTGRAARRARRRGRWVDLPRGRGV